MEDYNDGGQSSNRVISISDDNDHGDGDLLININLYS